MKPLLVTVALTLSLALATPVSASRPQPFHWPESSRHLIILDGVAGVLPQAEWDRIRDTVLMRYMSAGFQFTVVRTAPMTCAGEPPEPGEGAIVLCSGFPQTFYRVEGEYILGATTVLQQDEGVFCHELGHALGLDHYTRRPKRRSCMWSIEYNKPSPHDIAVLLGMHG